MLQDKLKKNVARITGPLLSTKQKRAGNPQGVRHLENFGLGKFINKLEQFPIVLGSFKSSFSH